MHQAGLERSLVFPESRDETTDYLAATNGVARRSVERQFVAFALRVLAIRYDWHLPAIGRGRCSPRDREGSRDSA
jgi:hypothetical protein